MSWLLWTVLLWTLGCMHLFDLEFCLDICPEVGLLDHMGFLGIGDGQGSLACCSPWSHKESDTTEQLNWTELMGFLRKSPAMQEDLGSIPGREDLLQKKMATHFSILARRILWIEGPGRLQSMGMQRVRHDWVSDTRTAALHPTWSHIHVCLVSRGTHTTQSSQSVKETNFVIKKMDLLIYFGSTVSSFLCYCVGFPVVEVSRGYYCLAEHEL